MTGSGFVAVDTNVMTWEERTIEHVGRTYYRKILFEDPESGVRFVLVRYPAGMINPRHTHPCGHVVYVLEGRLVTHRGVFAPGTFVWFPEGEVMEHGASPDGDVVALFVLGKGFRIDYVDTP